MAERWSPRPSEQQKLESKRTSKEKAPERKKEFTVENFERDIRKAVTSCTRISKDFLEGFADVLQDRSVRNHFLAAGASVGFATVSIGVSPIGREIGERVDLATADMFEARNVSKIDAAFDKAAKAFRADAKFRDEFSPEVIEAIAEEIETFSAARVLGEISKKSGLSVAELAVRNNIEQVMVYSDVEVDAYLEHRRARTLYNPADAVRYQKEAKTDVEYAHNAAGLASDERVIFLNITKLALDKDASIADIRAATREVIYHEFLHCFPVPRYGNNEALRLFYEGETEILAGVLARDIDGAEKDGYASYRGGPAAAAAIALEAVGEEHRMDAWRGYVQGDIEVLPRFFDEKYGDRSFANALYKYELYIGDGAKEKNPNINYDQVYDAYQQSVIIHGLIEAMGTDGDAVVERANDLLQTGKIIPIRGKTRNGVMLVGDNWQGQVTNGLITMYNPETGHARHVLFGGYKYDTNFDYVPETNAVLVNVDLDGYSRGKHIDSKTFEQRGAAVVKMIKSYDADLKDLRSR